MQVQKISQTQIGTNKVSNYKSANTMSAKLRSQPMTDSVHFGNLATLAAAIVKPTAKDTRMLFGLRFIPDVIHPGSHLSVSQFQPAKAIERLRGIEHTVLSKRAELTGYNPEDFDEYINAVLRNESSDLEAALCRPKTTEQYGKFSSFVSDTMMRDDGVFVSLWKRPDAKKILISDEENRTSTRMRQHIIDTFGQYDNPKIISFKDENGKMHSLRSLYHNGVFQGMEIAPLLRIDS